jgi:hypothetical protein
VLLVVLSTSRNAVLGFPSRMAVGGSNPSRRAKRAGQRSSSKRSLMERFWRWQSFPSLPHPCGAFHYAP